LKKKLFTHLGHTYDDLGYVQFVMKKVIDGAKIDDIKKEFVEENPVGINSENTRKRYVNWIVKGYVKGFKTKELKIFAEILANESIHPQVKKEIMFWKSCRSDDVERVITKNFIFERYQNGKDFTRKELTHFVSQYVFLSQSTIEKITSGYIALVENLGVISSKKTNYNFNFYRPRIESITFILFYLLNSKHTPTQILKADDFKYLLVSEKNLPFMMKQIQSDGLISFASAGSVVRLEPKMKFEEIKNVLRR
jgi:hypothetical protein